jgi:hypothetical protein
MLILLINDKNGLIDRNPLAYLVQFNAKITHEQIQDVEHKRLKHVISNNTVAGLVADISKVHAADGEVIREGMLSDFPDHVYDTYNLTTL